MNASQLNPSFVLSLIALVMASAGTGYAALGDGDRGGAVSAGNSRGEPVEIQVRNRSRGETGLVTASDGYSLRLSNTEEGGGGGAVYGCRAPDAPPGDNLACLYADNLRGGKAFLFRSRGGPTVGHFDIGNPANPPFTTNATGLVANLNADKVDGLDAAQLQGQQGPAGPAGPAGPQGPEGSVVAYANIFGNGDVEEANSKNITDANVSKTETGRYCFRNLPFTPKAVVASSRAISTGAAADDRFATTIVTTGGALVCPDIPDEQAAVQIWDVSAGARADGVFTVFFED